MIPGFNHNVMHRGNVYHVQTEDSGLQNPLISTHLFLGGNVLAARKTSYADIAGRPDVEDGVRKLMQEQHKQMLRQLVRGAFDREGAAAASSAYQPGQVAEAAAAAKRAPPAAAPAPATASPLPLAAAPVEDPPVLARGPRAAPTRPPVVIPEIEDEDLMSDRRLDEVILAYLADPGMKRG
jgi:hypothetical protein